MSASAQSSSENPSASDIRGMSMDDLHQLFEKKVRKYGIDRLLPLLMISEQEKVEGYQIARYYSKAENDSHTKHHIVMILFYQVIQNDFLFQQLQELLNETNTGTNNLLNVSSNFQDLKKSQFYWNLNKQYSLAFYNNSQYRDSILLLMNTKRQLSLSLRGCNEVLDVSVLCDIHTLDLSYCNVEDVSPLSGVYSLNLANCEQLDDVGDLGRVHTLILKGCPGIVDISALGGVSNLDLSDCTEITDVRALGGVHTLSLRRCQRVTDVSMLENVYELDLFNCNGIADVRALSRVRILNLRHCRRVRDVSTLGGLHELDIRDCPRVIDVKALERVHLLSLSHGAISHCTNIRDDEEDDDYLCKDEHEDYDSDDDTEGDDYESDDDINNSDDDNNNNNDNNNGYGSSNIEPNQYGITNAEYQEHLDFEAAWRRSHGGDSDGYDSDENEHNEL